MTRAEWLHAYDADHQHPLNRWLHLFGISVIGISTIVVWSTPLHGAALCALGFGAQFVGHAIEKKPPSFTRDVRYMAIGAVWYGHTLRGELVRLRRFVARA